MNGRVLLVEDERAIQIALSGLLRKEGYDVLVASSGDEAIVKLEQEPFDLVLTDLALGKGRNGMDVLAASKRVRTETPVVMITAHGNEKIAVDAMKAGAEDYVPKPFDNDEIRLVVRRALDRTRLEREHRLLLERIEREYGFGSLIGSGPAMRKVFETIQKVAETDLTVLIRGESGTGKELVAQALHHRSQRRDRPFVAVNCAAISRELVESELFGHEKGAFTGADARRIGRFEAADGGTIFLDEIGDMPLETQAKVLRVLQERMLERVGGNTPIAIDVRVVAATHRDLENEVEEGRFREDLYYRLRVVRDRSPAAPRALRGRPGAGRSLPHEPRRAAWARQDAHLLRGPQRTHAARLAGQRARASQRGRAGGRARDRCGHRACGSVADEEAEQARPRRDPRGGRPLRRGEAPGGGRVRARLSLAGAQGARRQHLAHRRVDRHGPPEPAAEDPRARTSHRGLEVAMMSLISRLSCLIPKRDEAPEVAFNRVIGERQRRYYELKMAIAKILFLRNKLEADLRERRAEVARVHHEARSATRIGQDRRALALLERMNHLKGRLADAEAQVEEIKTEAALVTRDLARISESIRDLEREKRETLAKLTSADVRKRLRKLLSEANEERDNQRLEKVRAMVARASAEASLDRELGDDSSLLALADPSARIELARLKARLLPA